MSCRVIANHFVHRGRDLSDFIERQAIAALAVALGPRAFSEQWELSIGADTATGAVTFTIEGPSFVRQYRFIGPPNQVGQLRNRHNGAPRCHDSTGPLVFRLQAVLRHFDWNPRH